MRSKKLNLLVILKTQLIASSKFARELFSKVATRARTHFNSHAAKPERKINRKGETFCQESCRRSVEYRIFSPLFRQSCMQPVPKPVPNRTQPKRTRGAGRKSGSGPLIPESPRSKLSKGGWARKGSRLGARPNGLRLHRSKFIGRVVIGRTARESFNASTSRADRDILGVTGEV